MNVNEIEFDLSQDNEAERLAEFCKALVFHGARFTTARRDCYVIVTVKA